MPPFIYDLPYHKRSHSDPSPMIRRRTFTSGITLRTAYNDTAASPRYTAPNLLPAQDIHVPHALSPIPEIPAPRLRRVKQRLSGSRSISKPLLTVPSDLRPTVTSLFPMEGVEATAQQSESRVSSEHQKEPPTSSTAPPPLADTPVYIPPNLITRFYAHLATAESLIRQNGKFRFRGGTFTVKPLRYRAQTRDFPTRFFESMNAAQRAMASTTPFPEPGSPLEVFALLSELAKQVLCEALGSRELDQRSWGWGIKGLAAGYLAPHPLASDEGFKVMKGKLEESLWELQGEGEIEKARRRVHVRARVLEERMVGSAWEGLSWYMLVAVAERWCGALGWEGRVDWGVVGAGVRME